MQVDLKTFDALLASLEAAVAVSRLLPVDRFQLFKEFDPFDRIPPALLNAGHLASYAITAGMIEPFDRCQLTKPATYLAQVEGECRYRDDEGNLVSFYLTSDPTARSTHLEVRDWVRLAPNSVCYLTLLPEFRMPAYIGARFNLLIRDVYRGLLVGTGPLVDPGFVGRLSIPIHNFTNKEYYIKAGEGLVYFEFTKLSWSNPAPPATLPTWIPRPINDQPPFPASKARRDSLDDYLRAATGGGPPASAIGPTMKTMREQAIETNNLLRFFTVAGVIAAVLLYISAWSLYIGAQQFTQAAQAELVDDREKIWDELSVLRAKQAELEALSVSPEAEPLQFPLE